MRQQATLESRSAAPLEAEEQMKRSRAGDWREREAPSLRYSLARLRALK